MEEDYRVVLVAPAGVIGLEPQSQTFLLDRGIEIISAEAEPEHLVLYRDLGEMIREQGILLDPAVATPAISRHLAGAKEAHGDARGQALERALGLACSQVPGWRVKKLNFKTSNEELDIVVSNNSAKSPWNGSAYILVEAKNWSSNVDRAEFDAFYNKVKERGGSCKLGMFVSSAGFSKGFYERASHFGIEHFSIVPVTASWLVAELGEGSSIESAFARRVDSVVLDRRWEED